MAEISREKAIKHIKKIPFIRLNAKQCDALEKAISDMQKLEKIDEIVKCTVDGICHKTAQKCFECMCDKLDEIEQIVRGEE